MMGKWFCAGCDQERPEYKEFTHMSGNPNFCKICACATASYYADEPRPKVSGDWDFERVPQLEQVSKLHGAKYITGEIPLEKETYNRPLENIIKDNWLIYAKKRAWAAKNLENHKLKSTQKTKKRKKTKSITSDDLTKAELNELWQNTGNKWMKREEKHNKTKQKD